MASRFPRPFPAAVGVSQHPGGQILPTPAEDPADSNLSISTIVIFYKIYIVNNFTLNHKSNTCT